MAAPLFYKFAVNTHNAKILLAKLRRFKAKEEPLMTITCKSPMGLTRQERYERAKKLINHKSPESID